MFSFFLGIIIRNNDSYKKITQQQQNSIKYNMYFILFPPKKTVA